jgi:hypothetical protein
MKAVNVQESVISLELTDTGIRRVTIFADDAREQGGAHFILAAVSAEIRALDEALKTLTNEQK